jgi:uncharacterized membrane protein
MDAWYSASVLGFSVYLMLWLFFVYSFAGVLIEGVFCLALDRVLQLRLGLVYLPLRPLYGVGGLACTVLLYGLLDHPVLVFVLGALICSVVEYLASLLTETAFGTVSWDYRDKWLNLQGRVCAPYSACWGVLALAALYAVDAVLHGQVYKPPRGSGELLLTVLVALTLLSVVLTLPALDRARRRVDARHTPPAERGNAPRRRWDRLTERLVPDAVLILSFPAMTLVTELKELSDPAPSAG